MKTSIEKGILCQREEIKEKQQKTARIIHRQIRKETELITSREHQTVRTMVLMVIRSREIPTQVRMVISRDRIARTVRMLMAPIRIRTVRADPRAVRVTIRTVVRLVRVMASSVSRALTVVRAALVLIIRIARELLIRGSVLLRKRKKATENCFLCWRCWC